MLLNIMYVIIILLMRRQCKTSVNDNIIYKEHKNKYLHTVLMLKWNGLDHAAKDNVISFPTILTITNLIINRMLNIGKHIE